jgi:hypothetical protein
MLNWLVMVLVILGAFSIYLLVTQPQNFLYYAERIIVVIGSILLFVFKLVFKLFEGLINLISGLFSRR